MSKMTASKMVYKLLLSFEERIEQSCNQSSRDSHYEAARQCAIIHVTNILKLSGLPQYQIVFWRKVLTKLEEQKI